MITEDVEVRLATIKTHGGKRPAEAFQCPKCQAQIFRRCQTKSGRPACTSHRARIDLLATYRKNDRARARA